MFMYYVGVLFLFFLCIFSPIGALVSVANDLVYQESIVSDVQYDFAHATEYEVEGNSMAVFGFGDGARIDVVPASDFVIGDIVAFTCDHKACDGAYIKKITNKVDDCYWMEGRDDVWEEDGIRKQSYDSRTAFDWLCGDDIDIYGVAFHKAT